MIQLRILLFFVCISSFLGGFLGCSTTVGTTPEATLGHLPSKGAVGKTIKKNANRFISCGRESVTIQTGGIQKMQLVFTVAPDGHVINPIIQKMSQPDPDLYSCILDALKSMQFPKPKDMKQKKITYPLVIKQK